MSLDFKTKWNAKSHIYASKTPNKVCCLQTAYCKWSLDYFTYEKVSQNCPGRLLAETVKIQDRDYTDSLLVQIIMFSYLIPCTLEFTSMEVVREPR